MDDTGTTPWIRRCRFALDRTVNVRSHPGNPHGNAKCRMDNQLESSVRITYVSHYCAYSCVSANHLGYQTRIQLIKRRHC